MKKAVAATLMAIMMVPFIGGVAQAGVKDGVACLFYYTIRERDLTDYVECFV